MKKNFIRNGKKGIKTCFAFAAILSLFTLGLDTKLIAQDTGDTAGDNTSTLDQSGNVGGASDSGLNFPITVNVGDGNEGPSNSGDDNANVDQTSQNNSNDAGSSAGLASGDSSTATASGGASSSNEISEGNSSGDGVDGKDGDDGNNGNNGNDGDSGKSNELSCGTCFLPISSCVCIKPVIASYSGGSFTNATKVIKEVKVSGSGKNKTKKVTIKRIPISTPKITSNVMNYAATPNVAMAPNVTHAKASGNGSITQLINLLQMLIQMLIQIMNQSLAGLS